MSTTKSTRRKPRPFRSGGRCECPAAHRATYSGQCIGIAEDRCEECGRDVCARCVGARNTAADEMLCEACWAPAMFPEVPANAAAR